MKNSVKQKIRNYIAGGKTNLAVDLLSRYTSSDKEMADSIVSIAARYKNYLQSKHGNLVEEKILNIELNKINHAILFILQQDNDPETGLTARIKYHFNLGYALFFSGALSVILYFYVNKEPFDLTVNIHGKKGLMDNPLKNEGVVYLRLIKTDFQDSAKIGEGGEAVFKKLPSQYFGEAANLSINAEVYEARYPDSTYSLSNKLNLEVKAKKLDRVWGYVFSRENGFLEGVEVKILDSVSYTDKYGRFSFYLPQNQDRDLSLFAKKEGYTTYDGNAIFNVKVDPASLAGDGQQIGLIQIKTEK